MGLDHVDLLVALDRDPEVMRFLTGRPSTPDEVRVAVEESGSNRWVAFASATDEFVGWFGLEPRPDNAYEIGYRLARRWWGQGLATEGTQALIDAAFSTLGARRVTAQTMAVNERSRRVMEQCAMTHGRTFHLEWADPLPGTEAGEVEYELSLETWRAR